MAIKNYFFGDRDEKDSISGLMDYRSAKPETFALSGNAYNDERFTDGNLIITSGVNKVTDSSAITHSGTEYIIADIHPDYQDFLDAIDKNIPILTNWALKGNLRHGYRISGNINQNSVYLKIISQKENNLLLVSDNEGKEFSIFVDWTTINKSCFLSLPFFMESHIEGTDLYFTKDFEDFCSQNRCRPVLFPTK